MKTKLVDFGVAKDTHRSRNNGLTQLGSFLGTPNYASPEQLQGRDVDSRSDLWSLAVLVFECLTGTLPFQDASLATTCATILRGPPPSLCALDASLPPALDAWWYRAVARNPDQRFQSAKESADGFAEAAGCAPVSVLSSKPRVDTIGAHGEPSTTSGSRFSQRWPAWVALLALCLLPPILALMKLGSGIGGARAADGGWVPSASELPHAIASTVVLMPAAADGLLREVQQSASPTVGVTARGANQVSPIQLRCDLLGARTLAPLGDASAQVSMR